MSARGRRWPWFRTGAERLRQAIADYLHDLASGASSDPIEEHVRFLLERAMREALELIEDEARRRVAHDVVGGIEVSTVRIRPPRFVPWPEDWPTFETMVFGGVLHREQWRWCTREEAARGHAAVLELVRRTLH